MTWSFEISWGSVAPLSVTVLTLTLNPVILVLSVKFLTTAWPITSLASLISENAFKVSCSRLILTFGNCLLFLMPLLYFCPCQACRGAVGISATIRFKMDEHVAVARHSETEDPHSSQMWGSCGASRLSQRLRKLETAYKRLWRSHQPMSTIFSCSGKVALACYPVELCCRFVNLKSQS